MNVFYDKSFLILLVLLWSKTTQTCKYFQFHAFVLITSHDLVLVKPNAVDSC